MRSIGILPFVVFITAVQSCKTDKTFQPVKNLSEFQNTTFVPTLENEISKDKNSIYCSTLLLAWDEIRDTVKTPFQIDSSLYDLFLLNSSQSYAGSLQKGEYNSETRVKGDQITVRAEFRKSLPFETELNHFDDELTFNKQKVKSFGSFGYDYLMIDIIQVLYYDDDNNFIVKLSPKDREHEIILSMTEGNFKTISDLIKDVDGKLKVAEQERQNYALGWKYSLRDDDEVVIPNLNFNIETNYATLEGKAFKSLDMHFKIEEAWQRIAFVLDEKGAEIESESDIGVAAAADSVVIAPKKMRFDKPFFLMLKRTDSKNPYFACWVADAELMVKQY